VAGGPLPECSFVAAERSRGLVEVQLELDGGRQTIRVDAG
jgi:hypothetical protein